MITDALYLTMSGSLDVAGSGLIWEKEVIYVAEFTKGKQEFRVDEKLIDHWIKEFGVMSQHGFRVKLPVEHTFDPEKNRGHAIAFTKKLDSKGRIGMFATLEFLDAEAAKLARSTDVSIYSPPTYQMGNGYTANRPITHVALTDYPVVPGLDPFETLAASLKEVMEMSIKDLAAKLSMSIPAEVTDDDAISELIVAEVTKLRSAAADATKPNDKTAAMEASMTKMMKELRSTKIDALVLDCKLTPAEATQWKKTYSEPTTVSFSVNDGFDSAFSLAAQRTPIAKLGEKTASQYNFDPETNPLMKDAKRRAGA